jgi:hypothetical protein
MRWNPGDALKKELEELQTNMNGLLEDERKNNRGKQDENNARTHSAEQRHNELQERSASSFKNSREEAQ